MVLSLSVKCNPINRSAIFNALTRHDQYGNRIPPDLSLPLLLQPWGLFVSLTMGSKFKGALLASFIIQAFSELASARRGDIEDRENSLAWS